ncbi:MAG: protein translocase subunit SecD [Candidatus Kapaibacterium sp.]|nr:protein translocase subunit SecD [Ignavibacteriota bacterium]MCB9220262.1 protein translocase subunit SecD [Ignavibacteria bacterium]
MKSKIGKIALIVIPIIAAIFALYPSYNYSQLESKRAEYLQRASQAANPADSLAIMNEFKKNYGQEYQSAKENSLQLGLDLKGGMYVTMEVDVVKLLRETAQKEAIDETFDRVLEATEKESQTSDESVVDIFARKFNEIAKPEGKSLISYFDLGDISNATEEGILEELTNNADGAINQAQEVIRQRIDKYGVSEPNIQKQGSRRILLELPGVTDESQIRSLLETTARLEFKLVRSNAALVQSFQKIDNMLAEKQGNKPISANATQTDSAKVTEQEVPAPSPSTEISSTEAADENKDVVEVADTNDTQEETKKDTTNPYEGLSETDAQNLYASKHPFTRMFATFWVGDNKNGQMQPVSYDISSFPQQGNYYFRIHEDSLAKLKIMLTDPKIKSLLPFDTELAFQAKSEATESEKITGQFLDFYGLKSEPELTGDVIIDAGKNVDPTTNSWVVNMSMNSDGSEKWASITGANVGKRIAIVLDGNVYSAPNVNSKISGGSSQISGMANAKEASLLEIVLKAGALKAPVKIIEEKVVGASLGDDSIASGINSTLFAFGLVVLFMMLYYSRAGLVADISLLINILVIFTILASLGGTLSLPGIAGIVLTLGMAVDANILIFERVREELNKGRSIRSAIDEGFSKAMSAIFDSNITTFMTGLILYYVGTGLIRGFALTLMIGILSTLFTAIMVSRSLIELQLSDGKNPSFSFGQSKNS